MISPRFILNVAYKNNESITFKRLLLFDFKDLSKHTQDPTRINRVYSYHTRIYLFFSLVAGVCSCAFDALQQHFPLEIILNALINFPYNFFSLFLPHSQFKMLLKCEQTQKFPWSAVNCEKKDRFLLQRCTHCKIGNNHLTFHSYSLFYTVYNKIYVD